MRNRIIISILTIALLLGLVSCASHPQFHYSMYEFQQIKDVEETKNFSFDGEEAPDEYLKKTQNIYKNLSNYYSINKQMPNVVYLTDEKMLEYDIPYNEFGGLLAFYNNGTIYLHDAEINQEGYIAHELTHSLADEQNEESYGGFNYVVCGVVLGKALDEGTCNYFSTQLYPHDEYYIVYEYETHVAKVLSLIFGEENLRDAYFRGDVNPLRDDFNKEVEKYFPTRHVEGTNIVLTPFDDMISSMSSYLFYENAFYISVMTNVNDEQVKEYAARCYFLALSIEEMLVFYGREKGLKNEVCAEMEDFSNKNIGLNNFCSLLGLQGGDIFEQIQ